MTVTHEDPVLPDDLLAAFAGRADRYDRENAFFHEDFADLRAAGYLTVALPPAFGGAGLGLPEVAAAQRRLAYHAPATALATGMHLYWTGVAADLHRAGDDSLDWLLREAAAGEVFAAGHGEPGNDRDLEYARTVAVPHGDGGYRVTGHKTFTSLSPVWTRLGVHALDDSDPEHPKIVHAFVDRDAPGVRIEDTWDTVGQRATRSDDTHLADVPVPAGRVARVLAAGPTGDPFVASIFAWAEVLFASVYYGLARRALDLAVASAKRRPSVKLGRPVAHDPYVQWSVAEATVELEGVLAHIERVADDWAAGVDHGDDWPVKLVAVKYHATESAKRVVDHAVKAAGAGALRTGELSRLYRDVLAGTFHPANSATVHELVGKSVLGLLAAGER
ncbi:putative acyl-CoA dehydrogenase YdbM [Actinomadura rubteroloni]|uniref:Putative acyl-CoA dehydrogenase YdbM n=1 Tax=Actinomadura rubteroloni TaxID=1926885 RepID=A0A2P4URF8_9ACTN|nr:acyl-CoA dehydrogenase family protein [Actinomadura rubteroloni]POM27633.1 putative acyl-CoA dehydrogenase YdbM [Actinomadura rubteroloni]